MSQDTVSARMDIKKLLRVVVRIIRDGSKDSVPNPS